MHASRILIIDFGSQYTQIIARRIRELGVYCEIYSYTASNDSIKQFAPQGIILSGGPESVTENETPRIPAIIFELNRPILGICYGMQALALQLGGQVIGGRKREFGYANVTLPETSNLFGNIADRINDQNLAELDVWMSHGDQVGTLPPGFKVIASTENCLISGMANEAINYYGLQFHPEVSHTPQGKKILSHFLFDICHCEATWTTQNFIKTSVTHIRKQVGDEHVLLGLSGGVDSSVAALLLHQSIKDQLVCVFVDTGLLRLNEVHEVQALFAKHFGLQLITINAAERFMNALEGVNDPEAKRKIIGKTFIEVFDEAAAKISQVKWLAQGTIYSDVIESAATSTGKAHVIKSHHNVGGLPETMQLKLLEPLRELFKDEVRELGLALGLPLELIHRHPFPGPGLGVRVVGEVQLNYLEKLRLADSILIEELHKADLYHKVSQAFAVFLPVKSVGVVGDARHYEHVIALRVVETIDFMTAHWAHLPYDFLAHVSNRIINEVPGISRVTYDISSKPPATIEWE